MLGRFHRTCKDVPQHLGYQSVEKIECHRLDDSGQWHGLQGRMDRQLGDNNLEVLGPVAWIWIAALQKRSATPVRTIKFSSSLTLIKFEGRRQQQNRTG